VADWLAEEGAEEIGAMKQGACLCLDMLDCEYKLAVRWPAEAVVGGEES
jgi:hypothetical protein